MVVRDQDCDKNIMQLLNQQNIAYSCQSNNIIVQNQDEIAFDLNLKDSIISSSISIENVKIVTIDILNFQQLQAQQFRNLISFNQIQELVIKNISISQCIYFQTLIIAEQVQSITVGQILAKDLLINSAIQFTSSIIQIDQISLVNSQICQLYFYGRDKLIINNIYNLYNASFIGVKECNTYSNYLSNYEINIQNIIFDLSQVNASLEQTFNKLSRIYIFQDEQNDPKIKIGLISYYSSYTTSPHFEVIEFNQNSGQFVDIQINKFIYQNKNSSSSFQLNVVNIKNFQINSIVAEGFYRSLQSYSQESLIKLFNTVTINFYSITVLKSDNINGSIIQCLNAQSFEIQNIKLQYLEIYSSFIDLQIIGFVNIQNTNIANTKFFGYLINAYNILHFYFKYADIQYILTSQKLFNLKNLGDGQFMQIKLNKINTDQNQSIIFYLKLELQQFENKILFSEIDADLQSKNNLQFLTLNGSNYNFRMFFSNISNGSSIDFGGCLNFINTFNANQNQNINLSGNIFKQCKSKYLGGAISGVSQEQSQNNYIKCSSQIGGAIYAVHEIKNETDQKQFQENKAYLDANNFNISPLKLKILKILEINQMNPNYTNLFIQTDQYLYPGLTYIIRLSIQVDGEWYDQYTEKNNFGNLFNYLVSPSQNFISQTPLQFQSIDFPFIIWSAQDIQFSGKYEIEFEAIQIYFAKFYNLNATQYKIYNGCKEQGMEKVYLDQQYNMQFICKYCEQMKVSYDGVCQNCQVEYFQQCYGNYSELKQSYWRSIFSVGSQDIYYCSNNPQSCQGGSGIGNELCYEGHVGAQCLNCDIYGTYWNEKYSSVGFFQCVRSKK
ncbi:hypothetical protein ABPG72_021200 [Tetrahymena utriculariae]